MTFPNLKQSTVTIFLMGKFPKKNKKQIKKKQQITAIKIKQRFIYTFQCPPTLLLAFSPVQRVIQGQGQIYVAPGKLKNVNSSLNGK